MRLYSPQYLPINSHYRYINSYPLIRRYCPIRIRIDPEQIPRNVENFRIGVGKLLLQKCRDCGDGDLFSFIRFGVVELLEAQPHQVSELVNGFLVDGLLCGLVVC